MLESSYLESDREMVKKLKKIPALADFSEKDFAGLMGLSKIRQYSSGEKIIKEGDLDCWIYFLIYGKVKVVKNNKTISIIQKSGDIFGEMAIFDNLHRSATIIAIDQTTCLASDISYIDRLNGIDKFRFGYFLYKTLAKVIVKRLQLTSELLIQAQDTTNSNNFLAPPDESHKDNIVITLINKNGKINILSGGVIGRQGIGKQILKSCDKTSRLHARLQFFDNTWHIEDLKSKNGTFLNGKKLDPLVPTPVSKNDKIRFTPNDTEDNTFIVHF